MVAIAEAAAPWLLPVEAAADQPVRTPYFLFLGTLEPRKNLETLVEAWRMVRRGLDVDLVLAGRRRADGPAFAPEPGLRLAGEVADGELAGLYSGAVALVYPSRYEGFGLPVVEAMQCARGRFTGRQLSALASDGAVGREFPWRKHTLQEDGKCRPKACSTLRECASDRP